MNAKREGMARMRIVPESGNPSRLMLTSRAAVPSAFTNSSQIVFNDAPEPLDVDRISVEVRRLPQISGGQSRRADHLDS